MSTLLGVDVGGTFTDFLLWDDGAIRVHKRPSTPDDPGRAVLDGLDHLGVTPELIVHGTTVATNAVLQRRGARTALVTTEGFRDLLTIGRQTRPYIYDLEPETPEPLVDPALLFECAGRLRPDGTIEHPWTVEEARAVLARAEAAGAEAVAVSLLFAYLDPSLERAFREAGTSLFLSLSSEVSPEYREVERTATTALNSYVGPIMSTYLQRLGDGVAARGVRSLHVVQSDGGAASTDRASRFPVSTLLSGPAAGVHGAFEVARAAGFDRIITFDMGGTSTDVALCDRAVPTRPDVIVGDFAARTPVVDVHTVGAGGGSIARLDAGGALRVGPESAGAVPGPACYGRGEDFTVTDAQAVLGRLGHGQLAGSMSLDLERARAAARPFEAALGDAAATAEAVLRVATANMERALRVVSVQRGFDPREFTLIPFGGAGPLHACALADALEMPRILVPAMPGVLCALGAVQSDLTATRTRSVLRPLTAEHGDALAAALREVGEEARTVLDDARAEVRYALDLRYAGQSYELTIDVADPSAPLAAAPGFHAAHEQRFAHADPVAAVEVVNVRAVARVPSETPIPEPVPGRGATEVARGVVTVDGREYDAPFYQREDFRPGDQVSGPAVVLQVDTTTLVEPGWTARADHLGNLLLERSR
ncbi:MAG: hydantoinase/oxoprolinase family protein [Dehalococcoidia bacterium]|nr:hydantoinase/oxoprolinase family protein [Dehalococcoidia bacterium]